MNTIPRILAIVGGAFLIGTGQAVFFESVTLGPANLKTGTDGVKGDPNRAPKQASDPTPEQPIETIPEQVVPADPSGAQDALLNAPVPDGTLTLREAKILWDEGAYFIDARHEEEFNAGHIQYAALLLAQWFDSDPDRAFAVTDTIPTDATIVIYCVGGECDASKNTAAWLEPLGYTDLRIMGAGFEHWQAAGFETETSQPGNSQTGGGGS